MRAVLASRKVFEDVEEHRQPNGETIYVQVLKSPVYDAHGNVVGIQGMFWDVSARRRAEEALRASDARFRSLVRSNVMGILMVHMDGSISEANDAFLSLVGYDRNDFGLGPVALGQARPRRSMPRSTSAGIEQLKTTGDCAPWEKELICKDGRRVHVLNGLAVLQGKPRPLPVLRGRHLDAERGGGPTQAGQRGGRPGQPGQKRVRRQHEP